MLARERVELFTVTGFGEAKIQDRRHSQRCQLKDIRGNHLLAAVSAFDGPLVLNRLGAIHPEQVTHPFVDRKPNGAFFPCERERIRGLSRAGGACDDMNGRDGLGRLLHLSLLRCRGLNDAMSSSRSVVRREGCTFSRQGEVESGREETCDGPGRKAPPHALKAVIIF